MARFRNSPAGSLSILFAIGTITVVAWGIYAWRFADNDTADSQAETLFAETDESTAGDNEYATLKATRPTQKPDSATVDTTDGSTDGDLLPERPSVGANSPYALNSGQEIAIESIPGEQTEPGAEMLRVAREELAVGEMVAARASLSRALALGLTPDDEEFATRKLGHLADALLFSRASNTDDPLIDIYTTQPGDTLNGIANKYHITEAMLIDINRMAQPQQLPVGTRVKALRGPFRVVIWKQRHQMNVYLGDTLVHSYRVGLGTNGGTPTGTWTVRNKLENPDWTNPVTNQHYSADNPQNPIGEYWIGLHGIAGEAAGRTGFGIHGTIEPQSIGENMSMGCVRLVPDDIKAVHRMLVRQHSQVEIRP